MAETKNFEEKKGKMVWWEECIEYYSLHHRPGTKVAAVCISTLNFDETMNDEFSLKFTFCDGPQLKISMHWRTHMILQLIAECLIEMKTMPKVRNTSAET